MKPNQQHQKRIGPYLLEKVIGTGVFGSVYLGKSTKSNLSSLKLAIKAIPKQNLNELQKQRFEQEKLNLIALSSHPYIVPLYDIIITGNNYYLVMQYCEGGDLRQFIDANKKIQESQLQIWAAQLAVGIGSMHKQNIVHRDLKPENILLSEKSEQAILYIADLGLSLKLQQSDMASTMCGTPLYSAPEVLQGQEYDYKTDLYSLGIMMYELIVGFTPFNATTVKQLKEMQQGGIQNFYNVEISQQCQELIQSLTVYNKEVRINIEQLLENKWIKQGILQLNNEFEMVMPTELVNQQQQLEEKKQYEIDQEEQQILKSSEHLVQQIYLQKGKGKDQEIFQCIQRLKTNIEKAEQRQEALFEQICKEDYLESLKISLYASKYLDQEIKMALQIYNSYQAYDQSLNPLINELKLNLDNGYQFYQEFLSQCKELQEKIYQDMQWNQNVVKKFNESKVHQNLDQIQACSDVLEHLEAQLQNYGIYLVDLKQTLYNFDKDKDLLQVPMDKSFEQQFQECQEKEEQGEYIFVDSRNEKIQK